MYWFLLREKDLFSDDITKWMNKCLTDFHLIIDQFEFSSWFETQFVITSSQPHLLSVWWFVAVLADYLRGGYLEGRGTVPLAPNVRYSSPQKHSERWFPLKEDLLINSALNELEIVVKFEIIVMKIESQYRSYSF